MAQFVDITGTALIISFLFIMGPKALLVELRGGLYFGARNDRECGKLTFFWTSMMTFRWPMMIVVVILGFHFINHLIPDLSVLNNAAVMIKTALPGI
ncbi:MAG TPA: hypothetical protein VGD14_10365 [bacterium]